MAIPYLTLKDTAAAIAIYSKAFDAQTVMVMDGPGGSIMHAEINIGGTRVMMGSEWPGQSVAPSGRSPVNFMLYVDNVEQALEKAVSAGMRKISDPEDMFWGDRMARVNDGHGYEWTLSQEVEKVSAEEVKARAAEWLKSMG